MAHIAVLCPEATGHLNPMTTLMAELRRRGHRLTWIGTLDGQELVEARGFSTITIAEETFPRGSLEKLLAEVGELSGFAAARFTLAAYRTAMETMVQEVPDAIRGCGAEVILGDESIFASRTIADMLNLPWITVCNALPMHPDPDHPPLLPAWQYRPGFWGRVRNYVAQWPGRMLLAPIYRVIAAARRRHNLEPYDFLRANASQLATIAQLPAEFDYPRAENPSWLHYVGALHDLKTRPAVPFPYGKLDERPLIYASLGTVQNRLRPVYGTIAAACNKLPVQLVISMGGGQRAGDIGSLPGNPLVVDYAPQLELIRRATLVITHAGMNTTMESLAAGKPMVAIPITNDQPAVAARIAWSGCGRSIPLNRVTEKALESATRVVLSEPCYAKNAERLASANTAAGGVTRAADIIEARTGMANSLS